MEWNEFDIDEAEEALATAHHRVAMYGPARPEYAARIKELEMVVDWFHQFENLELDLLTAEITPGN